MFKLKWTIMAFAAALLLTSCGYSLYGTGGAAGPYKGAYRVFVPVFVNDTYEPLVEGDVTRALKDEIAQDGRWVLTDAADADMVVKGRVASFELLPLSYDAEARILEYRVRIVAEMKLVDIKTGKVLWKASGMEAFADYRLTADITKSKIGKSEAVKKASKYLAEEFIIKALDIF